MDTQSRSKNILSLLGSPAHCFSLEITAWIQRRGSRLHFWSGVGWCCCFSCHNLPSSIYTAQQGHHIRKSSRELLEIECWPYRDANPTSSWSLSASRLMSQNWHVKLGG